MQEASCTNDYLWLPLIQGTDDITSWMINDEEWPRDPEWLKWEPGQPNGDGRQKCAGMGIGETSSHLIYDLKCSRSDVCSLCQLKEFVYFKIRGICSNLMRVMDFEYIIDTKQLLDTLEKGVTWTGISKTDIVFDGALKRWKISSKLDNNTTTLMDLAVML